VSTNSGFLFAGMTDTAAAQPSRTGTYQPSRLMIWADRWIPMAVLSPSLLVSLIFVYGFMLLTGYLSFTTSRLMPNYTFSGLDRYRELFANDVWWSSVSNLLWFAIPFIGVSVTFGLILAILMDQRIRAEGGLRAIMLYPLALSQIVAGTAWQWLFNPTFGFQAAVQNLGWSDFQFNWLGDTRLAVFCVVIAVVWQCTGFVAALFLAGLRGIDDEIIKAAKVDGASMPTIYRRIIIPMIRPVFFSVLLILAHLAIKTFDIIVAMTAGGPGTSTWLPSIFMYVFSFERGLMGLGAASSMMMLAMVFAVVVPLMYLESRATRNA
jgi:glucose/mannose transport system permease protein